MEGKRVIVSENACTFHNSFWVTGPGCRLGSLMFCFSTGRALFPDTVVFPEKRSGPVWRQMLDFLLSALAPH